MKPWFTLTAVNEQERNAGRSKFRSFIKVAYLTKFNLYHFTQYSYDKLRSRVRHFNKHIYCVFDGQQLNMIFYFKHLVLGECELWS